MLNYFNFTDMKPVDSILVLTLLFLGGCSGKNDQPDAYGTFEATEITVSAMANGKLLQFQVEEGQILDSGQVIGFVDTTDLYLKKRQAIDQRSATASRIADLQAQVAVQEQNRENVLIEKRRVENLLKSGAATQKQLDDITASLNLIERQIASIKTQFTGVDNQVRSIEQQVAQLEESIRNAYIINPVTGTVLTKFAEPDEVTVFGKPLYKIADLREMTLRVYVSGAQLPQIRIGSEVNVMFDKDQKTNTTTTGLVSWVSPTAEFTPKTIQTKEERVNLVYAVKVKVKNDGSLKIGMPGEIKLINP
ncbi:MAG: HlyD family efflux transporter periplasmic adaptor subunit [bacterium]